jgi:hypothetical protein
LGHDQGNASSQEQESSVIPYGSFFLFLGNLQCHANVLSSAYYYCYDYYSSSNGNYYYYYFLGKYYDAIVFGSWIEAIVCHDPSSSNNHDNNIGCPCPKHIRDDTNRSSIYGGRF